MFMPQEPTAIDQAVSRAIRDNLESIQRTTDELNQAVNDVVAACASSKPANALPPMLRAQSTAASIAAALEVLSRFVAITLNPSPRSPLEAEMTRLTSAISAEAAQRPRGVAPAHETSAPAVHEPAPLVGDSTQSAPSNEFAPAAHPTIESDPSHQPQHFAPEPAPLEIPQPGPFPDEIEVETEGDFDVNQLSAEEQELHRRANRVAKVSMQDIKMLRPEAVRLGRENKDLCVRLRDDIEKAHREYDRRFRPIMDHPVDYFYRWMVEILADGDAHALGEYPYAIHAHHR
jgi:hypothetical protein